MAEPRPSSSGSTTQLSAKIMEAQVYFQKVVKQEMQVLVASGLEREVAVKMLLRRIVQSTYEPEKSDVKRVMRQFQMIHDDAVRALIVKQEIGRLKRQGLDAFAAIELLTKKMQGICVPDEEGDEETKEESSPENMSDQTISPVDTSQCNEETTTINTEMLESSPTEDTENKETTKDMQKTEDQILLEATDIGEENQSPSCEESASTSTQGSNSAASLSLCERIDQVSISVTSPDIDTLPTSTQLTTSHTTPQTEFALFSAYSRKRRCASSSVSPLNENSDTPLSPLPPLSSSHVSEFSISRPLSPTFRFPKNKKQKIWTDESNEPVLDTISLKEASIPPPASPTGVGTRGDTPPSSVTATPTKAGKRRRALRGGSASPELDEIDVEDPIVRVSKRHKV